MDKMKILARIDELLSRERQGVADDEGRASEIYQGAVSMLGLVHGPNSVQLRTLNDHISGIQKSKIEHFRVTLAIARTSHGALENLKREVEEGLVGNLRREVTGEVLSELVLLAKATLEEGAAGSKNVAAVLVAAAFEDTIRRLGATYCGVQTRESLPFILDKLKTAEVLKGSQVGVVQSHFQFRNDAMHADWDKIDVVGVKTVAALVQELLLKHFS